MHSIRLAVFLGILSAVSVVNAHFRILYPEARGPYVGAGQLEFCDDYYTAGNRTEFPLTKGLVVFNTSHPQWTAGLMISTQPNPSTFDDFHNSTGGDQMAVPYFQSSGKNFCFEVNIDSLGLGVTDGSSVTLQMVFNGGDTVLYQCVDLTISSSFTIPSEIITTCQNMTANIPGYNGTVSNTTTSTSSSATGTATGAVSANGGGTSQREAIGSISSILIAGALAGVILF